MKYYAVAEITINSTDCVAPYAQSVTKLVEAAGGKYLARTSDAELLEGDDCVKNTSLIIEFPTKEAAYTFYESEEYAPYLTSRKAGSSGRFILIAGKDDANTSSIM